MQSITCPVCRRTSWNPNDVREGYCGYCHDWTRDQGCAFCAIVADRAPAVIIRRWPDAVAFRPLNPVVRGHVLVVPRVHVVDARVDPYETGQTFRCAAELAAEMTGVDVNLITSAGAAATQTVMHLHVHVIPRTEGDGLALPWTGQQP